MNQSKEMKTITLKEIANQLELSVTTVSKALKAYPDVSKKTRDRVKTLAEKLNYVPNSFAVSLRMQKSKTIGVIVPETVHYFFSKVIDSILKEAEKNNYVVILMQSKEDYELEKKQIDLLLNKGVDGILISLSNKTSNLDHLKKIQALGIPLVLFDKIAKTINCSKVKIDDRKSAYEAVTYLIKKGHKRIAHFRGGLNPQNSIDRFLGYKKALLDNDINFDSSLVYLCDNDSDFDDGFKNAKKLIQDHGNNVDALFTMNDLLAIGALNYLNSVNINVPEDIALIGFSNWFMSSVVTPTLSSIEQNGYEIGEKSAQILFHEIDCKFKGIITKPQQIIVDTELIIRNSS
ncbi:LacI family transcriptional regulator [Flaviramulus sp. BrNp1-15]|uniref:LacI family DNA-binding transcriptional regulator n=1 Tax=Flaviramulus sp. BrNp1-15 TaxID=2916754 RepID=UPI001EE8CE50|nr:LacI family DNA-binding transcriptional regulator [Flaviramulus sp. BrNp1-15]ULC60902.1 LacI family transcriptional regulator [Flaviramulus sp. BrNp1-15]